jgi:hypothetical protein
MTSTNFNYYEFRENKLRKNIEEEIQFFGNHSMSQAPNIKEYLEYLQTRIHGKKPQHSTNKLFFNPKFHSQREKMVLDEHCKDLDTITFKKPWNKLKEFHKIMKFKEFINELKYKKNTKKDLIMRNKNTLVEELIFGMHNKKFCKGGTEINYNSDKMKIESISCISYNKKDNFYEIEWDD